jgi:hypothetical protein
MISRLATGRIVWAEISDPNGIRKLRPAVIVTPTSRLTATEPFDVVAVSSRLTDPLPEDQVLLPWHAQGHPRTGLNRRCAAICTWLAQITEGEIHLVGGLVPTPVMNIILAKIQSALPAPPPPPADTSGSGNE